MKLAIVPHIFAGGPRSSQTHGHGVEFDVNGYGCIRRFSLIRAGSRFCG